MRRERTAPRLDEVAIDSRGYAYCGGCADDRDAPRAGVKPALDASWRHRASTQCRGVAGQACDGCGGTFVEASRPRVNYLDYDVRNPDGTERLT